MFELPEIIFLVILTGFDAISTLVSDLGIAIPFIGIAIVGFAKVFHILAWAVTLFWFIMKLGAFGAIGIILLVGGILEFFGIPATLLIGTAVGIFLANHPRVAKVAETAVAVGGAAAATIATGGAAAPVAGGAAAAEAGAAGAVATTEGAVAAEASAAAASVRGGVVGAEGAMMEGGASAGAAGGQAASKEAGGIGGAEERREGTSVVRGPWESEQERMGAPSRRTGTALASEEAFGVEKEPLERVRELMENMPEPPHKKEDQVEMDDEGNLNLRKAA